MESVNPESQLNPKRWYHRCAVWPTKNLYPTYWKTVPPNAGIEAGKFLTVGVLDDATYWDRSCSNVKNLTKSCVEPRLKSVVTRVHEQLEISSSVNFDVSLLAGAKQCLQLFARNIGEDTPFRRALPSSLDLKPSTGATKTSVGSLSF